MEINDHHFVCLFIGKTKVVRTTEPTTPPKQPRYVPACACHGDHSGGGYSGDVGIGAHDD
jgi:hypothetical protein